MHYSLTQINSFTNNQLQCMLEALPSYTRVGKPAPNSSHFPGKPGIIMEASRSLSCKEDIVVEVHQKTTILSRISCQICKGLAVF